MGLMEMFDQCIMVGYEMMKVIVIVQFNDDSLEVRKIICCWCVGEVVDLIGVFFQVICDVEKVGCFFYFDMEMCGCVEQWVGYIIE